SDIATTAAEGLGLGLELEPERGRARAANQRTAGLQNMPRRGEKRQPAVAAKRQVVRDHWPAQVGQVDLRQAALQADSAGPVGRRRGAGRVGRRGGAAVEAVRLSSNGAGHCERHWVVRYTEVAVEKQAVLRFAGESTCRLLLEVRMSKLR